ncbi:MAG: hypothetical protein WC783_00555 [Candidatus Paceibacterota bacterium]
MVIFKKIKEFFINQLLSIARKIIFKFSDDYAYYEIQRKNKYIDQLQKERCELTSYIIGMEPYLNEKGVHTLKLRIDNLGKENRELKSNLSTAQMELNRLYGSYIILPNINNNVRFYTKSMAASCNYDYDYYRGEVVIGFYTDPYNERLDEVKEFVIEKKNYLNQIYYNKNGDYGRPDYKF